MSPAAIALPVPAAVPEFLAPRIENEFLRIAQEAVANAIRHSGARQIVVTLSYDAGEGALADVT